MGHQWQYCNHRRSMIFGSPWVVHVAFNSKKQVQIWGDKKCVTADEPGRWILMNSGEPCSPPMCSGIDGEAISIEQMGWRGEKNQWIWVPYTCYYHLYSKSDLKYCSDKTNLKWLLITGDSQVREFIEHLHLIGGYTDVFGKFAGLERPALVEGLRVTFQFFEYAYLVNQNIKDNNGNTHPFSRGWWPYLEHFNILPSCTSGQPISNYLPNLNLDPNAAPISTTEYKSRERLSETETEKPNAWVWNLSGAYAAQDMTWSEFRNWVYTALDYLTKANITKPPENLEFPEETYPFGSNTQECRVLIKDGKDSDNAKLKDTQTRTFWYRSPFTFSQAHPDSPWLTQSRVSKYDSFAANIFKQSGMGIIDTTSLTQSRMEDSWDGLHFMRSTIEDCGHGLVSTMVQQTILNAIFPDCDGS
eukprot:c21491_g1_i1.p1 GENE.c21491_g1_i1~~c21491_g1_i1.p1  ORF type:complete len:416 (-),score=142.09 c21491_g1_i1:30-1277(-)